MKTEAAQAAQSIRVELKKLGIKASITSDSNFRWSSVRVRVFNQSAASMAKIQAICLQYQKGHFDGMRDLYVFSNAREGVPQVKAVCICNES